MTAPPTLSEPGEWVGEWWVPGLDTREVGILTYDPTDGLDLRLLRTASRSPFGDTGRPNDMPSWPVLHGNVRGVPVTLLYVRCTMMRATQAVRAAEWEAQVDTFLQGCHLPDADQAVFVRATIEIDWLTDWSGAKSLTIADSDAVEVTMNRPDFRSVLQARMEHDEQEVLAGGA